MNNEQSTKVKILLEYMRAFLPADDNDKDVMLKSSQDIQDDLSDMVEVSIGDISKEMLSCGYKIEVDDDNKPKWRMMRK